MRKIDTNSGVQANVGFDFQRNTCLYLFLEKYNTLKNLNYFIMLEHYDDIVFGFLNLNGELTNVITYQAKKSSKVWTTNQIYEIVQKICNSGIELQKDDLKKTPDYNQAQHFITNNTIALDYQCTSTLKTRKMYVNETNENVKYLALNPDCQSALRKGNGEIQFDDEQISHFQNLNFSYVDLNRSTTAQLEMLTGKFKTIFGKSILDHMAARDTFIYYLKEIESTYNQGDRPKLSDTKKKIDSSKINEILQVLTTKNLAIEFCRKKSNQICQELSINVFDAMNFELDFENSLDEFKDLRQGEHQKIIRFIDRKKSLFLNFTDDVQCIKELYDLFLKEHNSTLSPNQIKAAISAGYFLILTQK